MRFCCLAVALSASLALGQATAPAPAQPAPVAPRMKASPAAPEKKAEVSPETPVITVQGVCDSSTAHPADHSAAKTTAKPPATAGHPATPAADCKTVITRAQFESLADALQPNMPPATRKQLATFYPKLLLYAQEARRQGIDKDPKIKQAIEFKHLQALAQEFVRSTQEKATQVSEAEIEKYYKANDAVFEQVGLQRLYIANNKIHNPDENQNDKEDAAKAEQIRKDDEDAMKKEADSVHTRASAGEDFEKLQKEAYDVAGLQGTPPKTDIGKLTRAELPVNHRAALDLNVGQVSQIFVEGNGYYLYKVISKDVKPLAQVHDQIRQTLAQQKAQDALQAIDQTSKADLNEAYFATAAPAPARLPAAPSAAPRSLVAPPAGNNPPAAAPVTTPPKPAESTPPAPQGPGDPKH
jgi:hypothetical protein